MRILILNAQPGRAEMLASNLRAAGYSALGFSRPTDALAAMREADVLATDYDMPEMTGLEVARRAYDQGWRGSLFIMPGHFTSLDEALEHPFLPYILKMTDRSCRAREV